MELNDETDSKWQTANLQTHSIYYAAAGFVQSVENFETGFCYVSALDPVSCRYRQGQAAVWALLFFSMHFSYRMHHPAIRNLYGTCSFDIFNDTPGRDRYRPIAGRSSVPRRHPQISDVR